MTIFHPFFRIDGLLRFIPFRHLLFSSILLSGVAVNSAAAANLFLTETKSESTTVANVAKQGDSIPLPKMLRLKPLRTLRHDDDSFCQGLFYEFDAELGKGILYESSGRYGRSAMKRVDLESGKILRQTKLGKKFFGEGATAVRDQIFQLTWNEGVCFIYDKATLRTVRQFRYQGEGWGITFDGTDLIVSDGSETLTFFDPDRFQKKRTVHVFWNNPKTGRKEKIAYLNELEFIEGEVWANVYQSTCVVRIDPKTGEVIQILDFARYVPKEFVGDSEFVLNGIAWNQSERKIYLTGKNWPVLYELGMENDPVRPVSANATSAVPSVKPVIQPSEMKSGSIPLPSKSPVPSTSNGSTFPERR